MSIQFNLFSFINFIHTKPILNEGLRLNNLQKTSCFAERFIAFIINLINSIFEYKWQVYILKESLAVAFTALCNIIFTCSEIQRIYISVGQIPHNN